MLQTMTDFFSVTDEDVYKLFNLLDSDRNGLLDYIEIDKILDVLPEFMLQFKDSNRNGLFDYLEIDRILDVLPKFILQFKDELYRTVSSFTIKVIEYSSKVFFLW